MSETAPGTAKKRFPRLGLSLGLVAVALAIAVAIWVSNGSTQAKECPVNKDALAKINDAAFGELAALNVSTQERSYADMAFQDKDGNPKTIKDFAGKTLLVNFWASWCVPCREEMPALNALAEKYNDAGFEVLPINLDIGTEGLGKAQKFLDEGKWAHLPLYADPSFKVFDRLKTQGVAFGLPATVLLDDKGCEMAVLQGPAHWDTPDGGNVVEALKSLLKI